MHRSRTIMIESELAHGEMPPLHVHAADESFHVFEGSLTVYLGEDAVRLEAGETLLAPAGIPHTYRAESAKARVLTMSRVDVRRALRRLPARRRAALGFRSARLGHGRGRGHGLRDRCRSRHHGSLCSR